MWLAFSNSCNTLLFFVFLVVETFYFKVKGLKKQNYSTVSVIDSKGTLNLDCYYGITLHPNISEIDSSGKALIKHVTNVGTTSPSYIRYVVPDSEKSYVHIYRCSDGNQHIQVTLEYSK